MSNSHTTKNRNKSRKTTQAGKRFVPSEGPAMRKQNDVAEDELNSLFATFDQLETKLALGIRDSIEIDTSILNPVYAIDIELELLTSSSWE
jgi:hypothetical protein